MKTFIILCRANHIPRDGFYYPRAYECIYNLLIGISWVKYIKKGPYPPKNLFMKKFKVILTKEYIINAVDSATAIEEADHAINREFEDAGNLINIFEINTHIVVITKKKK